MLTYENVLETFKGYLEEDTEREVIKTRHCYTSLLWDKAGHDWSESIPCESPEELFDALLEGYRMYQLYLMIGDEGDETPEMEKKLDELCAPYLEERERLERDGWQI